MTRLEIIAMITDQFSGRTDKNTTMGFSITNALSEIGQRHDWQSLKEIETDIELLSLEVTLVDGNWDVSAKELSHETLFDSYTWASGDMILITGGTGVTTGWYEIASKTTDTLTLVKNFSDDEVTDLTDVTASWIGTPQWIVLPAGVNKVHNIMFLDGLSSYPIEMRSKTTVDREFPDPSYGVGYLPVVGYRLTDKIMLAPFVDTQYSVRLTTTSHPTLASGDDAKPTLDGVENTLIARVLMDLYMGEEFESARNYWEAQYEKSFRFLMKNDVRKTGTRYKAEPDFPLPRPNAVSDITTVRFDPYGR